MPLLCALGLFIYQTLDAIDGKQARRTKSSNALGELFDHGCDSMSTVFVTLAGACTMGMGHMPYWMMYECFTASVLFYLAHWQTYVTGEHLSGYSPFPFLRKMKQVVFFRTSADKELPKSRTSFECDIKHIIPGISRLPGKWFFMYQ